MSTLELLLCDSPVTAIYWLAASLYQERVDVCSSTAELLRNIHSVGSYRRNIAS